MLACKMFGGIFVCNCCVLFFFGFDYCSMDIATIKAGKFVMKKKVDEYEENSTYTVNTVESSYKLFF